jgi:glycosyltransferase involved in cell wall biosynthesis
MNEKIRIAFVLGSPFPTFKAYGVTTRETLNVLKDSSYTVKLFCPQSNYFDNDFAKIKDLVCNFHENLVSKIFIFIGQQGTLKLNQLCWRVGLYLNLLGNLYKIKRFNPGIVWTRDPMVAYVIVKSIRHIPVILEVHDGSGSIFYKYLRKYNSRLRYCPINEINSNFINTFDSEVKSLLAPMGIQRDIVATRQDCLEFIGLLEKKNFQNIEIAYVGNFAPGRYSKGVEDLIDLAEFLQHNSLRYFVTLIGATKSEIADFNSMNLTRKIDSKYLKVKPYVSHSEALVLMKNFDVLVLPAYKGEKYIGMPLKLIEYIAAARITVVADIQLYRNLFFENFQPFFYSSEGPRSLFESIELAVNYKNLETKIIDGIDFVHKFTWDKRTEKIISFAKNHKVN